MSIEALKMGADVEATDEDVLPSGGGFTLATGLYPMIVDNAYLDKSSGGAMNMNIHLKIKGGDKRIFRHKIYMTSGKAKGGNPFYVKDGKKYPLPGYTLCDHVTKICAGLPVSQITPEKKLVKLYDFDQKAEVPREVPVVTEIVGKELLVGIQAKRENKRVQDSSGNWVDGPEPRDFDEVTKVFHPDGFTVTEKAAEAEEAKFVQKWKAANPSDYVADKFKPVAGQAPAATAGPAATAAAAPDDLFDD
jgi:hypothetical protein